MPSNTYDAIVIGSGQAGPFVANRFAKSGMKVAIVERGLFGGTCVNTGCIPTKTMVASAYAAHMARRNSTEPRCRFVQSVFHMPGGNSTAATRC